MQEYKHAQVRNRNEVFAERTGSKIWCEQPSTDNSFIAKSALCHGYDIYELMAKRSFVDVFYLLFRGELPSPAQANLLQQLMIALINPGPRHPATRAAMNAGVGKTHTVHILPIASSVLGGDYLGGGEVEEAMRFIAAQQHLSLEECCRQVVTQYSLDALSANDYPLLPGFGCFYGGIDLFAQEVAERLAALPAAGESLHWGQQFAAALAVHNAGWRITGVAAVVLADLGFSPRSGAALFQLLGAPGLLAHGLEMAGKPIFAMPFVSDENYVVERNE